MHILYYIVLALNKPYVFYISKYKNYHKESNPGKRFKRPHFTLSYSNVIYFFILNYLNI
jgi:hypothetical protein